MIKKEFFMFFYLDVKEPKPACRQAGIKAVKLTTSSFSQTISSAGLAPMSLSSLTNGSL
jgi:hypothetical protein